MLPSKVLIVPALPVEAKAILSFFEDVDVRSAQGGATYLSGNRKIFATKLGEKIKENWAFQIASPTGAGNLEVTRALQRIIPECKPQIVALIGCAGGFPEKLDQYDVVVPPRVDYIARSKISDVVELRPQQEICSQTFVDHCKNVQLLDLWHQYLLPDVANAPINVHFEPIVCSETVLANSRSEFYESALKASPKAVAIEMEGYGFLSVCREHRVEAAILRGISDTLDDKAGPRLPELGADRAQYQATRHAAALFFATLDFVNARAFAGHERGAKKEVTEISLILDAEMHNVAEIQSDLFELFKKYGIRNFSFRPANSIRVGYEAQADAMRIYDALIKAGIVKSFAGFEVLDFKVRANKPPDRRLVEILSRIEKLAGASVADVLQTLKLENWLSEHPDLTGIVVDALKYQLEEDKKSAGRQTGRILHLRTDNPEDSLSPETYVGPRTYPRIVLTSPRQLREDLENWQPPLARNELTGWFMGSLLDRDIDLDVLLSASSQKLFYVWPGFQTVFEACHLTEKAFIDGCIEEWQAMPRAYPTLLSLLNQEREDRLSRTQIREALVARPATLSKAIQLLSLVCRVLHQNAMPVKGCIIPSLDVLVFNGTIAGDGAVERMLLTGLAGDLTKVADVTGLPLRAVQSAIRGGTLPLNAARDLASALQSLILKNTRLRVSNMVVGIDGVSSRREAVELGHDSVKRYLRPLS